MGKYTKQSIYFAIVDYFKAAKVWLIVDFLCVVCGLIIGIITKNPCDDAEIEIGAGRAAVWILFSVLIPYLFLTLATVSKIMVFSVFIAFLFLGVRLGVASEFLLCGAAFKGVWNLLIIYLPIFFVTFFALNLAIYYCLPYMSSSPNCKNYPNCYKSLRTVIKYLLIIFAGNLLFVFCWLLIFSGFCDVIVIVSV